MRLTHARRISGILVVGAGLALAVSCSRESNSVSAPTGGASAMNISGAWTGTFHPNDSGRCASSTATATFQQQGANVTGTLTTSACGVGGYFRGTITGNTLMGKVEMAGCTGGGVNGTVTASGLSLSIGDLMKPLVLGSTPAMSGGSANLAR